MDFYEMDPPAVYQSGQAVTGLAGGAAGLAQRYLNTLDQTREQVHHPTVKAALERYRDAWHAPVNEVGLEIDALGGNTSGSAVVVAASDEESSLLVTQQGTAVEARGSNLTRPVNTGTPV
jgi:hypothetical protein